MSSWEVVVTTWNPETETSSTVVYAMLEDYVYAQFIAKAAAVEDDDPYRTWSVRSAKSS